MNEWMNEWKKFIVQEECITTMNTQTSTKGCYGLTEKTGNPFTPLNMLARYLWYLLVHSKWHVDCVHWVHIKQKRDKRYMW